MGVQRLYVCAHNLHGLHQPHLPPVPHSYAILREGKNAIKKKKKDKKKSCTALAQFCCSLNSYSPPVCLHPTEVFFFLSSFFVLHVAVRHPNKTNK